MKGMILDLVFNNLADNRWKNKFVMYRKYFRFLPFKYQQIKIIEKMFQTSNYNDFILQ